MIIIAPCPPSKFFTSFENNAQTCSTKSKVSNNPLYRSLLLISAISLRRRRRATWNRRPQSSLFGSQSRRSREVLPLCSKCTFTASLTLTSPLTPTFLQAYGEAGVVKAVRIMKREIVLGMQLLGAKNVKELVPEMVCYPPVTYNWINVNHPFRLRR